MPNLLIKNIPEDLHASLQLWAKENNTSVSVLVINQLKQQIQLLKFERSLRKLHTTETPQDSVNAIHSGRDKR